MFDLATPTLGFFGVIALIIYFESKKREPCSHLRTRCIHGDEINWRAKQYVFRFWKTDIIRRQICVECKAPLDRIAICTATGVDQHEWEGSWPWDK